MIRIRPALALLALAATACGGSAAAEDDSCELTAAPGACVETRTSGGVSDVTTRTWDGDKLLTETVADGATGAIRSRLVQTWDRSGRLHTRATERNGAVEAIETLVYEGDLLARTELDRLGDGRVDRVTRHVYDGSKREVAAFFDDGADGTEETSHHWSYDEADHLRWEEDRSGDTVLLRTDYRYDLNGNRTGATTTGADGSPVSAVEYRYNEADQLAEERISTVGSPAEVWLYFYDANGWLRRKELSGGSYEERYMRDCAGNLILTTLHGARDTVTVDYDYACF